MSACQALRLFLLFSLPCLAAPSLLPTSPAEQQAVFEKLAATSRYATCEKDEDGNLTCLVLNQLGPEKPFDDQAPGLSDADLPLLLHFPELRALTLCGQPLTDEGYAFLRAFPELEAVRLANLTVPKPGPPATGRATSEAILHLDGMRGLKVLDLTHTFRMQGDPDVLGEMRGFPELRTLIVDVGIADDPEELLPFLEKCPKLERLKLHRTTLSQVEFERLFEMLPELRYLEVKPRGNTSGKRWSHESLALVPEHPKLEVLRLIHGDALPLPWEDGLEHLVEAEHLKVLWFPERPDTGEEDHAVKEAELERLRAARPGLAINPGRSELQELKPDPVPYHWELGPK